MAIKLSTKDQDNIPTLTEIVTEGTGGPSRPKQSDQSNSAARNNADNNPLPPKFERVLEKLIYKKLHQQLVATSQSLAAEIMTELQKHFQDSNPESKPGKNNGEFWSSKWQQPCSASFKIDTIWFYTEIFCCVKSLISAN